LTTANSDAGFGIPTSMIILRVTVMGLAFLFCAQGFAFDTVENLPTTLRSGSHYCEGCPDGVIASARGRLHSVEIDYRLAQLRSRGKLRDVSQLGPAIQLEDGRVSCLSCHSQTSQLKAKLVTSNEGSLLCFYCHNL
jgi:predicted CXXCH cytochrome family protein